MLPVWDEAFSIFPAADFLVKHGFDYSLLLTQPNYHDGGPTAHALSLLTFLTALVLKMTGGGMLAWAILHITQWLMAAAISTMLTRIYGNLFEEITAFLLAVTTLAYPLMLAQLGKMYIEVPLLFFSVLAFYLYRKDRIWLASLSLVAACMTKESGVIAVGGLALLAVCSQSKPIGKRYGNVLILALPSMVMILILQIIVPTIDPTSLSLSPSYPFRDIGSILFYRNIFVYIDYISTIPELIFILVNSVLMSILLISRNLYQYIKQVQQESDIIIYNCYIVVLFSILHFIAHAYMLKTNDPNLLSRYFFFVIPSMFIVIYYPFYKILKGSKINGFIFLIIICIFLINRSGMLYPPIPYSNSIAISERSEEYIDGYKVQKEYIGMIGKEIPDNVPIFVNLPDYFLMHYSVSGYVQKPHPNVHFIGHVLKSGGNNGFIYPDHFVLVYHYPYLGGLEIKRIVQLISENKEFSFKILGSFKKGYFNANVYEIKSRRTSII